MQPLEVPIKQVPVRETDDLRLQTTLSIVIPERILYLMVNVYVWCECIFTFEFGQLGSWSIVG